MRAIYLENLYEDCGTEVLLDQKERVHHLASVLRARVGDEILLLNGKGLKVSSEIVNISKKSISLRVDKIEQLEKKKPLDLFLCIPKREALDLSLKQAVELGVNSITLIESSYSQRIKLNPERIQKILISALEQSNNPFLPEIIGPLSFDECLKKSSMIACFTSNKKAAKAKEAKGVEGFLIGPEGGFRLEEEELLVGPKIFLELPIMRTPTALTCAYGYLTALQTI